MRLYKGNMNRKDAFRMALKKEHDRPLKHKELPDLDKVISTNKSGDSYSTENKIDHHIAVAMDNKETLLRLAGQLKRLEKTKDVQGYIQDIAPDLIAQLSMIAMDEEQPAKVRIEALKDMLDRAGYGKVIKHAVAKVSVSDSKDAIISHIMGAQKDLSKVGIDIVEDDEDNKETT